MRIDLSDKMKDKGITIAYLSRELKLAYRTTYKLATGQATSVNLEVLGKICDLLNTDVAEIMVHNTEIIKHKKTKKTKI